MRRAGWLVPVSEPSEPAPHAEQACAATLVTDRLEAKYLVARADASALRARVAARLSAHHHSAPPGIGFHAEHRHITTTTYLDTARRDLYRAAASSPVHIKVRVRRYRDEILGRPSADALFLELKERDGTYSRKRRTALARDDATRLFEALAQPDAGATRRACEAIAASGADGVLLHDLAQTRRTLGAALQPSCVVRYRREAFQDVQATLRVTFDHDVQVFEPLDDALESPVYEEPACVLEAKSTASLPGWLVELFAEHGARAAEYSKLVMASRAVHGR